MRSGRGIGGCGTFSTACASYMDAGSGRDQNRGRDRWKKRISKTINGIDEEGQD